MSTTITRDEWLAEFERVANAHASDDGRGMTVAEFMVATGHSNHWVHVRLQALRPRLIVTKRCGVAIDGRPILTPCYRLKPEG